MTGEKKSDVKSREDRLAEQLRANLRRRKAAARKTRQIDDRKKDAPEP
ncbi:hypothetical protein ACFFUB_11580 [Algimonas porphyrae]|uniref:DUF4169 family protein n=1 Tax=Algimonas porphyrae TaxID=1128113 RepID=A0ABQ5UWJ2_9PROT|nr:hypothetical protein [Algimonas porphyrae]GLQ19052.1 hypothetical protein GCM10007854_00070 [Algimonas porphyrae]